MPFTFELAAQEAGDTAVQDTSVYVPPAEPDRSIFEDVARGVAGGALNAVTFGFFDEETAFGGALNAQTTVGGFAQGTANFLVGFIPILGAISKGSKLARVARLGRLSDTAIAGAASATRQRLLKNIVRPAVAGAITDFAVFDAHEARLSNWLTTIDNPILNNSVTEYLQADEDDSQIEGRLKNAIEGLGLGIATDAVFAGIKRLKVHADGINKGLSDEAAEEAAKEAVPDSEIVGATGREVVSEPEVIPEVTDEALQDTIDNITSPRGSDPETPGSPVEDILEEATIIDSEGIPVKVNPRKLSQEELLRLRLQNTQVNLQYYHTPEDRLAVLRAAESVLGEPKPQVEPKTRVEIEADLQEEVSLFADYIDGNPQELLATLKSQAGENLQALEAATNKHHAIRTILDGVATQYGEKLRGVDFSDISDEDLFQLVKDSENIAETLSTYRAEAAVIGRSLRSEAFTFDPTVFGEDGLRKAFTPEEAKAGIENLGGREKVVAFLEQQKGTFEHQGPGALVAHTDKSLGSRVLDAGIEYYINNLVSGLRTHSTNVFGNGIAAYTRPLEQMFGHLIRGNLAGVRRAFVEINALKDGITNAAKMGLDTLRTGETKFNSAAKADLPTGRANAISAEALGLDPSSGLGRSVTQIGSVLNLPTRLLLAEDEAARVLSARSFLTGHFWEQGVKQGLNEEDLAAFIQGGLDRTFKDGSLQTKARIEERFKAELEADPELSAAIPEGSLGRSKYLKDQVDKYLKDNPDQLPTVQEALRVTDEVTFTEDLTGPLKGFADFVNKYPALKLVAPFVRTPINLLRGAARRTNVFQAAAALEEAVFPANFQVARKLQFAGVQEYLNASPAKKAAIEGRLLNGAGFVTVAAFAVQEGKLSGRGPTDPEMRAQLEAAGWQPYSVRIGDAWVSYERIEPFRTIIGGVADLMTYAGFGHDVDTQEIQGAGTALVMSLANNITNKSYLRGVFEWTSMLSDPERYGPKFAQNFAGALVPFSGFLGQTAPVIEGDDTVKEVNSWLDNVYRRVPGWGDKVPPMRNMLGEPIRKSKALGTDTVGQITNIFVPIMYRDVSSDTIGQELADLKYPFGPPSPRFGDLDLRDVRENGRIAYDRYGELVGTVKVNGRTLRDSLSRMFATKRYQALPSESTELLDSPRVTEIKRVLRNFRRVAKRQLVSEFPELQNVDVRRREQLVRQRSPLRDFIGEEYGR